MTDPLYSRDAYARSTEAIVISLRPASDVDQEPTDLVLDRTVFYPGGGGQPSDRGLLRASGRQPRTIVGARRAGADVVHELEAGDEPPDIGEQVEVAIDWLRRYRLMRTHTALHALCGVVWRDYGAMVTGGNMEPGSGRMDFEFERMSGDLVDEIERRVNVELVGKTGVNPATNQLTNTPNTPVNIPHGGVQTFVIGFTPSATFGAAPPVVKVPLGPGLIWFWVRLSAPAWK